MLTLVFMVGAFPPPVHGMSAVNLADYGQLSAASGIPVVINLASKSLDRSFISRLGRIGRVLGGLVKLLFYPGAQGRVLYMSVSGG